MIWAFLLNNPLARLLGKVAAVALAVVTFGAWQRRQGAQAAAQKQAEANFKAVQDGAEGAANAKANLRKGKTPQQIKDGNDAKWD